MHASLVIVSRPGKEDLLKNSLVSIVPQLDRADCELILVHEDPDNTEVELSIKGLSMVRYFAIRHPNIPYHNPAKAANVGMKAAKGDVIILQHAEIMHASEELIIQMTKLATGHSHFNYASVKEIGGNVMGGGKDPGWYCHPTIRPHPGQFLWSVQRKYIYALGGYDENFIHYGYEDMDLFNRMKAKGYGEYWAPPDECLGLHQYHGYAPGTMERAWISESYYNEKRGKKVYPQLEPWVYEPRTSAVVA